MPAAKYQEHLYLDLLCRYLPMTQAATDKHRVSSWGSPSPLPPRVTRINDIWYHAARQQVPPQCPRLPAGNVVFVSYETAPFAYVVPNHFVLIP